MVSKPPTLGKSKPNLPPKPMPKPGASAAKAHTPKKFVVEEWSDEGEGEKIILYGRTGLGKTTLATMLPKPVFLGLDDGGRKIRHPHTGERIKAIPGIETFQDLRDAVRQPQLYHDALSVVVDTITKVDPLASTHIVNTITVKGSLVKTFRHFGWDGERHLLDQFRLLLSDLDGLVKQGLNVVLLAQLAQITVANAEGADYLEDGPKLQHRKDCSVRTELIEWADHVFRIGYLDFVVAKDDPKARAGKVISDDATRAIYTGGAQHYIAKSRPVTKEREKPCRIPPVVSFASEADDSLWAYVFRGAEIPVESEE